MPATSEDDIRRVLGEAIAARRIELGLSVSKAARMASVDRATWTAAEMGTRTLARHNRLGVENVLQWPPGSITTMIEFPERRPLDPATVAQSVREALDPRRNEVTHGRREVPATSRHIDSLGKEAYRIAALPIPAEDRLTLIMALIERLAADELEPPRTIQRRPSAAG